MTQSSCLSLLFVFLWSSAFIAFEFCSSYAEPATFILVRVTLAAVVLLVVSLLLKSAWPGRWVIVFHSAVVGILIHGVYAAGSYASIYHGMDVGFCALVLSLQPIVTALLSSCFLGEKITARKLFGVIAGTSGVAMIVLQATPVQITNTVQFGTDASTNNSVVANSLCVLALLAISIATIYQKRFCTNTPLVSGAFIQFLAATIFILPMAMLFETMQIEWNIQFGLGLIWLVLVISIGAMFLLMLLIRTHEAGAVANIFYLVTPMVAVEAWILFDESLSVTAIAGMLLCMAGVAVVNYNAPVSINNTIVPARNDVRGMQHANK